MVVVGELLASVLESGPHHHHAVELLRRLFTQLGEGDESLAAAGRLGSAVFGHWDRQTCAVLIPRIAAKLASPAPGDPGGRAGASASLTGLGPARRGSRISASEPEMTRRIIRSFVDSVGVF
jgi:hypothetical protein